MEYRTSSLRVGDKVKTKSLSSMANYQWSDKTGIIKSISESNVHLELDFPFLGHRSMDFNRRYWGFELYQEDWDR